MNFRAIKYLMPLPVMIAALFAFRGTGWVCYIPLIYAWIFVPVMELIIPPNSQNLQAIEEDLAKDNPWYDWVIYSMVAAHGIALFVFLKYISEPGLRTVDLIGRIGSMGLLCGTFGINIGHELGHRHNRWEQRLAKFSLLTSLYTHFFIEHNKGHHKHVATPQDPSSARLGEALYAFWPRTMFYTWMGAWKIAGNESKKKNGAVLHLKNEMIQLQCLQLLWLLGILWAFGWKTLLYYGIAAVIGMLLLETVNYIEHYGLQRKPTSAGHFERAMPHHSWNSNHMMGRLLLFELSRHSDHHYLASRKYQILRHHDTAPQMPTGYPGMMILSLCPPLWFRIMNDRAQAVNDAAGQK
jgi:alkane 1-monooxygenase